MSRQSIARYILRRLVTLAILLLVISFGVFCLIEAAPGSAEQVLMGEKPPTPEALQNVRERYHLDQPFIERYVNWLGAAVQGDFGDSIRTGEPVTEVMKPKIVLTAELAALAFLIAIWLGVPLGVLAATRAEATLDRGIVAVTVMGVSAPPFAIGTILIVIFAVYLGALPSFGPGSGFVDRLEHLVLPAITLSLAMIALVVRLTRAGMIHSLESDYVLFARARGIPPRRVIWHLALRNALIPIVTGAALILTFMLSGVVVVEATFQLPGLGALLVDSVKYFDVTTVQAICLWLSVLVVLINLAVDVLYVVIDPRIRLGAGVD